MTLDEIEEQWKDKKLGVKRDFWEKEIAGLEREFFHACRDAIKKGDRTTLEAWLDEDDSAKSEFLHFDYYDYGNLYPVFRAHLLCALAVLEHGHWLQQQVVPDAVLKPIAQQTGLALGFLRDLTYELLEQSRQPVRQLSINALLVDQILDEGVVATLTLELMPNGNSELYPIPELAFVFRDGTFRHAENNARQCVQEKLKLWSEGYDVRWHLQIRGKKPLFLRLEGGSAGAAFAVGLARLLVRYSIESKDFTEWLEALELAQVAVTAAIDASGQLEPVGGLWSKLLAAAKDAAALGLLRVVVVAADQEGVPEELLKHDATPLRVIRATTLQEAVEKLYFEHGPRSAVRQYEYEQCKRLDILGNSVPIEKHYQMLPLLREVKRERLPREEMGEPREMESREEEEHGRLQGLDIVRWEEELREEQVTYERHEVKDIFADFRRVVKEAKSNVPRFIVLGPPGSGKTTLEQYLAWVCSQPQSDLSEQGDAEDTLRRTLQHKVPVRVRLREWEAWAVKPVDPETSLPEYLTERYKDLHPAPTVEQWRRWLYHGEVLLLLDGLDEIAGNQSFLNTLKSALSTFKDCPTVLTCRTVSFEQHSSLCHDFPVFTLAGLKDDQRDAYIRIFPAEHRDHYDPDALIDQLNRTPQMRPLSANPLLLSIICYVVDDPNGVTLPATRAELYDKAVEKLLTRHRRVEVRYPGEEPDADEKRAILERTALYLLAKGRRGLTFTGMELGQELKRALSEEGYGPAPAPWANALRTDLTQNSGILRGRAEQGYFFLHLTLQEFLTAAALARLVDTKGWEAEIEMAGKEVTVHQLVDRKAWDLRWQEVIILLAGKLTDSPLEVLLTLLSDETKDDLFRHRLALAALCLPEIPEPSRNKQQATFVDKITTAAFSLWWEHRSNGTTDAVPHLTRMLPVLGQVNGRLNGTPLLVWLCQRLRDVDGDVRYGAAWVLGKMGEVAAQHPEVLPALVEVALRDEDKGVRDGTEWVFGEMGEAAAQHPEVLPVLVAALRGEDKNVRYGAARALGNIGEAAAQHPDVLPALVATLHDISVREWAAAALEEMREAAVRHPEVLPALVQLALHDEWARHNAGEVLGKLGEAAARHVLPALVAALRDVNEDVRKGAAWALGDMGEAAAQHPEVLSALVTALCDEDWVVRMRAAEALEEMGESAARHLDAISLLVAALRGEDDFGAPARKEAALALGKMGEAAARHPDVLPALVKVVLRDYFYVCERAVWALGNMGESAARHPDVLPTLVKVVLRASSVYVRLHAAWAW